MDTIDRVAEMLTTIDEFSELLEHETAAIKTANTVAIAKIGERKQFLALHYQRQMKMLSDRRSELAFLDKGVKARLQKSWLAFDARVNDNMRALEVAQCATRCVVDMIVDAIRDTQGGQGDRAYRATYKQSGETSKISGSACVSVALNRIL